MAAFSKHAFLAGVQLGRLRARSRSPRHYPNRATVLSSSEDSDNCSWEFESVATDGSWEVRTAEDLAEMWDEWQPPEVDTNTWS